MTNLSREQLFNLIFVFVATMGLGLLLGLSVLRTVDNRLSDVTINIPEIRVPEAKVQVELPPQYNPTIIGRDSYYPSLMIPSGTDAKNTIVTATKTTTGTEAKNTTGVDDSAIIEETQEGGQNQCMISRTNERQYGALNIPSDSYFTRDPKNPIPIGNAIYERMDRQIKYDNRITKKCPDVDNQSSCGSYFSSLSLQEMAAENLLKQMTPDPLKHPDFQKGYRSNVNNQNYSLVGRQLESMTDSRFTPRHPGRADWDPLSTFPDGSYSFNQPKTHQYVPPSMLGENGQYLDRPKSIINDGHDVKVVTVPVQHYKDPSEMTEQQRAKFMLTAKFDKMTPVDYRNWLLLYQKNQCDLSSYHRKMLRKVLKGEGLSKGDIPVGKHFPESASELWRRQIVLT